MDLVCVEFFVVPRAAELLEILQETLLGVFWDVLCLLGLKPAGKCFVFLSSGSTDALLVCTESLRATSNEDAGTSVIAFLTWSMVSDVVPQ